MIAQDIVFPEGIAVTDTTVWISADEGVVLVPLDAGPTTLVVDGMTRGVTADDERVYFSMSQAGTIGSTTLGGADFRTIGTELGFL